MGWFDKKSWQLRRKIRDLQTELAAAERQGKYVVAQGLFFAELQDMGDATMMVLGKADTFDTEEEAVIKNFFERNGFTVESLRLDKTHKTLAAVEILPPEEFTRRVAKSFKANGFKLIDDSDHEKPSTLEDKRITLSCLIRAISALFSSHVHQLIVSTPIKMNMEGNRLLHWMPLIRDALLAKVSNELVNQCREPFVDAYNHYYAQFGRIENPEALTTESVSSTSTLNQSDFSGENQVSGTSQSDSSAEWSAEPPSLGELSVDSPVSPQSDTSSSVQNQLETKSSTSADLTQRGVDAAQTLARMYKTLIGVTDQRKARNSEVLLDFVAQFFNARGVCIVARDNNVGPFRLVANSANYQCSEHTEDGQVNCEVALIEQSLAKKTAVASSLRDGSTKVAAVVAPLALDSSWEGALYIAEPSLYRDSDSPHLARFAQIFREFPDLLISLPKEK